MTNANRTTQTERRMESLNKFINITVMVILTAGSVAMALPSFASSTGLVFIEDRYLPHFFLGLVAVAVLFNVYLFAQKLAAHTARLAGKQHSISLVDPLTQLLSTTLGLGHSGHRVSSHLG